MTVPGDPPDVPEEIRDRAAQRASSLRSMFPGARPPAPPAGSAPLADFAPSDADPTVELPPPVSPLRRRPVLVAGVVAAALVAGGLTAYGVTGDSGTEPVRYSDTPPLPVTLKPYGPAEPVAAASPSPSPDSARPTHPTASPTGTTRAVPATVAGPSDLSGPLDGTGEILGIKGQCLDNNTSRTDDGNPIQVWACDQTPAQVWTVANGRYTVQGKCLSVAGGSTASGTRVVLWTCDGGPAQQWKAGSADGSVRNPASGLCLTAADGFSPVFISPCVADPGQRWARR